MGELNGKQKRYLRGLAHDLKPTVHIGKQGVTDALVAEAETALEHHELIKVKFVDWKDEKMDLAADLGKRLDGEIVGSIGHHVILFRPARQPELRRIRLPRGSSAGS